MRVTRLQLTATVGCSLDNRIRKRNIFVTSISLFRSKITSCNDLYKALVDDYPWLKTKINEAFKNNYKQKGTRTGNVIEYK